MSLTSHLRDSSSSVRRFFEQEFPDTQLMIRSTNRTLRGFPTIEPPVSDRSYPHATISTALDYRLRYFFAVTPLENLVAWQGACNLIQMQTDRTVLPIADPETGSIDLIVFGSSNSGSTSVIADDTAKRELDFFSGLHRELLRLRPNEMQLSNRDEELLARYCWGLALYEQVYRSGQVDERLQFATTADALLASAPQQVIQDLCCLARTFYERYHELVRLPSVLNPSFAGSRDVDGADGDLIVDRCLIDIKATKNPRLERLWLYQLLGYALLDYQNRYDIERVGIYYARQATLVAWDLNELVTTLRGGSPKTIVQLRDQLQRQISKRRTPIIKP